ncbi:HIT domain-containing protein [Candidatus Woesearchaeota archaeon]|nr:HIT domain-containing protein [Candidatus Woesearchaeota archaeon]
MELSEEDLKNMSPEELVELQKKNCIFCHIISGKVQSKKIYEDDVCIAILDINPANPGHILLMPKEHQTIMPQIPEPDVKHLFMVAKALSQSVLKALKAQGTNIFVANGVVAGQKSPHFMIHIIPRKENDGINCFQLKRKKTTTKQLDEIKKILLQKTKFEAAEKPKKQKVVEAEFKEKPKKKVVKKKTEKLVKKPTKKKEKEEDNGADLDSIARVMFGE